MTGMAFYLMASAFLLWAILRGEWGLAPLAESTSGSDPLTLHPIAFLFSIPFAALAFYFFSGNLFTTLNLTLWLIALALLIWSLWLANHNSSSIWQRAREFISRREWQIHISRWALLILAFSVVIIFFRVYHIQQTPAEPFSDHAEKLLDVYDVNSGTDPYLLPAQHRARSHPVLLDGTDELDLWNRSDLPDFEN